jgi:hypothetical protein
MTRNNKKKINKKYGAENKNGKIPHLPHSKGCPINPFHPFFFRILYPSRRMFRHLM